MPLECYMYSYHSEVCDCQRLVLQSGRSTAARVLLIRMAQFVGAEPLALPYSWSPFKDIRDDLLKETVFLIAAQCAGHTCTSM